MRAFARIVLLLLLNLWLTGLVGTFAADWNDFLGPERNGKSQEKIDITSMGRNGAADRLAQEDWHELRGTYRRRWATVYLRTLRQKGATHLHGNHNRRRTLAV